MKYTDMADFAFKYLGLDTKNDAWPRQRKTVAQQINRALKEAGVRKSNVTAFDFQIMLDNGFLSEYLSRYASTKRKKEMADARKLAEKRAALGKQLEGKISELGEEIARSTSNMRELGLFDEETESEILLASDPEEKERLLAKAVLDARKNGIIDERSEREILETLSYRPRHDATIGDLQRSIEGIERAVEELIVANRETNAMLSVILTEITDGKKFDSVRFQVKALRNVRESKNDMERIKRGEHDIGKTTRLIMSNNELADPYRFIDLKED